MDLITQTRPLGPSYSCTFVLSGVKVKLPLNMLAKINDGDIVMCRRTVKIWHCCARLSLTL